MSRFSKRVSSPQVLRSSRWFEKLMALIALANLGLVFFDLSYISWRNFYLQQFPSLVKVYDPVKAIEPERQTQTYLETVAQLEEQVVATGLQSPQTEAILRKLRLQSNRMIEENPFELANKSGTLAKIKNRIREYVGTESAREAFTTFWSVPYLSQTGWAKDISFFNTQIRPLIATNYYRPIGENNEFVDYFWLIDLPFVILFGLEFLARTFYINRRHPGIRWLDAMLWRWYDLFLLIPAWRWLRVISVIVRLHQAKLIDLERVRVQLNQGVAANLAEDLTKIVVIRVLDQIQDAVQRGDLVQQLVNLQSRTVQVDTNQVNEVEEIANLAVKLLVYEVIPQIQPDIAALLQHNIESALKTLPFYQGFQAIPGLGQLPAQITEKLVTEGTQAAYQTIVAALEDEVGAQLAKQLMQHLVSAIEVQVGNQQNVQKVQDLLTDLLEEVKLGYAKRWVTGGNLDEILEVAQQLNYSATRQLPK